MEELPNKALCCKCHANNVNQFLNILLSIRFPKLSILSLNNFTFTSCFPTLFCRVYACVKACFLLLLTLVKANL